MDNKRLILEYNAMRERWGERPKLCKSFDGKQLWWEYDIHVEGNTFPVSIAYPTNYPAKPPQIITPISLPTDTPHILPDNPVFGRKLRPGKRICWLDPSDKRSVNKWSPSKDTAALCVGVAHRWFLAFLVWYSSSNRTIDDWPVPDAIQ